MSRPIEPEGGVASIESEGDRSIGSHGPPDTWRRVERFVLALNRGLVGEALAMSSPDIDLRTPMISIWGLRTTGHDLVKEWFLRLEREWAFVEWYDLRFEEEGLDGWVLGRGRAHGRGKASRSELDWEIFLAARAAGGRLVNLRAYLSRAHAVDAATRPPSAGRD